MSQTLDSFVREALTSSLSRDQIREKLLEAGWPNDEISSALDAWADVEFPIPVPRPRPYLSARDAFGYLVLFTTLYISAIALIKVVYEVINHAFPDATTNIYSIERELSSLRWGTAALIIAFPLLFWLSRRIYVATRSDPEKRTSKIRKWLTYVTLFVAATALICDVITLVFFLLGGDLTARFLLKVTTVAAVAGAVFGYYLWDLKQGDLEPLPRGPGHPGLRLFAGSVTAVTLATVVTGIMIAGSPSTARSQRLDLLRVQHLVSIASSVDIYRSREGRLPPGLVSLATDRSAAPQAVRDPATNALYEYLPESDDSYRLCAVFETEDREPRIFYTRGAAFWGHGAGRHCYSVRTGDD